MTNAFQPIAIRPSGPKLHDRITPDVRYWSKYRKPTLHKESALINHLHFADSSPNLLSVTSGSKVQIYHPSTHEVAKTITRFNDLAYSGHLRSDGKLLVAGDEKGFVSVFEMGSRSVLRCFSGHSGPVHFTRFAANNTNVFSGSDDKTARIWDIPSNSVVNCFESHTDYVRAGVVSKENPNLVVTGSYDHTLRVWDTRTNTSVMTLNHESPVENVLMYPGSNALVSCGGAYFKVLDLVSGGRVLHKVSNHQKTITSISFDHSGSRLLTGSLDQSVKIYNVTNYKVVHTLKYSSPILSLAISPNDTHMAIGMLDGTLSFRSRDVDVDDMRSESGMHASYRTGSFRFFMRGQAYQPSASDYKVEKQKRPKLLPHDKFLRKFEYANALDVTFETGQAPAVVVTVIEELIDRAGLQRAVQGRTEEQLEPLLAFLTRYITHPHYTSTLCTVTHVVLDIYSKVLSKSIVLRKWLGKIENKLNVERGVVRNLAKVMGALDMVLANSAKTSELSVTWRESEEEIIQRVVDVQLQETLIAAEERMRLMDVPVQASCHGTDPLVNDCDGMGDGFSDDRASLVAESSDSDTTGDTCTEDRLTEQNSDERSLHCVVHDDATADSKLSPPPNTLVNSQPDEAGIIPDLDAEPVVAITADDGMSQTRRNITKRKKKKKKD